MRIPALATAILVWLMLASAPGVVDRLHAQATTPAATWPHAITTPNASVVVYQPQAVAWPEHRTLTARAAIAVTPQGAKAPILGTIDVSFTTATDAATNDVALSNPTLVASHFPSLDTAQAAQFEARIRQALPEIQIKHVPLQAVLLSLKEPSAAQGAPLQNDPPVIFHSTAPASLVVFDGEPVLAPVGKTGLSFAVNTNWDVFTDGKDWYLLNNGLWLAASASGGPYKPIAKLPAAFNALPADQNFADVRKAIPPRAGKPSVVPTIFVSTKPAEIIVTEGAPQFAPVAGTGLQWVRNTSSALYFEPASGRFFLLVSGRWFASTGLDGPWSFATDKLPPGFALISPDSPRAPVLASVPGTAQAQLAALQAQVPRQATLNRTSAQLKVIYSGPPEFRPIPGTPLAYAINTTFEVIETGGKYYVCYHGAWFAGASPNGPWALAESVPPAIYTIPPSSPLYNVTFVKVYGSNAMTVTYGYTSGYTMGFVTGGVVVYGTGYYYPPVVIAGPMPIYYPYPYSYAGGVWYNSATGAWAQGGAIYGPYGGAARGGTYYNPTTGAWARGGAIYGPNGGAGAFSYYNPTTGGYAHGSAAWGPGGGSANAGYYNPRTGISGSTQQNWNPYSRWGSSTVSGPNQTVNTASGSNARGSAGGFSSSTGAEGVGYRGAGGNQGGAVKTQSGDVYAGRDGNAYRHTSDGWSKWNDGGWNPVTPPTSPSSNRTSGNLQSGAAGRSAGSTRESMDSGSYRELEQDRQARFSGYGHRFEGGWGGGGGRFRR